MHRVRLRGHFALTLALGIPLVPACDEGAKKVADTAKQAGVTAKQAADGATKAVTEATKTVTDATKTASDAADAAGKKAGDAVDATTKVVDDAKAATARAWAGLTDDGELSKPALAWLQTQANAAEVKGVIAKGVQIAPVAFEIAKTVNAAVDSETVIEPIYQSLDGKDPAEVDKAVAAMPRVEVIDGLKIGFSQLGSVDAGTSVDERAYLITWRHEQHLVGLVYRTKRTIDLEMLVKEAPRLITLTKAALASEP